MPPKNKFTKEQIIDAAFDIANINGIEGITAKSIADKLGSSVAPIYVNFKDIDSLKDAVVERLFQIGYQLAKEDYTDDQFLNMGIGSLRLAEKHSVLFRELVLSKNKYMKDYDEKLEDALVRQMEVEPTLADFKENELRTILIKMRIFSLGLAAMIANNLLPPSYRNEEAVISLLSDTGQNIIAATRLKKKNTLN